MGADVLPRRRSQALVAHRLVVYRCRNVVRAWREEDPPAHVRTVPYRIAVGVEQRRAEIRRDDHRMFEPRRVPADPRREDHQHGDRRRSGSCNPFTYRARTSREERPGKERNEKQFLAASERRKANRDSEHHATSHSRFACDRFGDEQHERDHYCEQRLGQHLRVVHPQVRVERRNRGRDDTGPVAAVAAADEPDQRNRRTAQQARKQAVAHLAAEPDERRSGQHQRVQRRVRSGRIPDAGVRVQERVVPAAAVSEHLRERVEIERVASERLMPLGHQDIADAHDQADNRPRHDPPRKAT